MQQCRHCQSKCTIWPSDLEMAGLKGARNMNLNRRELFAGGRYIRRSGSLAARRRPTTIGQYSAATQAELIAVPVAFHGFDMIAKMMIVPLGDWFEQFKLTSLRRGFGL